MKKLFLLLALVATLIPAFFVIHKASGLENWQGVTPKGTTDSLYYYARMHEVVDGYPLNGNPYIYEYREAWTPSFFLPDIISAIPMLTGIPFNVGVMVNFLVWSFIFLLLGFKLLRLLEMPSKWVFVWTIILYISSYSFMLRPTVMQIVYPAFIAFLVALIKFLYEPMSRRRMMWLAITSAITFYVYMYLAYIVVISLIFVFIWFLWSKRIKELWSLIYTGILSAMLLIPFGLVSWVQIHSKYYFETMERIGLVHSYIPSKEAFLNGRWVVIALVVLVLMWFFTRNEENVDSERRVFLISTAMGLFLSLFLNVFTGVEMTLGMHVGRFVVLWMVIVLGVFINDWFRWLKVHTNKYKYAIVGICLTLLLVGVVRNIPRGLDFFKFDNRGSYKLQEVQSYSGPLNWLEENVPIESVVWANESISQYIPIMTRHYPLYFESALLHIMSNEELEDRFLLSKSSGTLMAGDIKSEFSQFAGSIPTSLRSDEYFKSMQDRFKVIKKSQADYLEKFNVKYLMIDRNHDEAKLASKSEPLYDDGRFVIVSIPNK